MRLAFVLAAGLLIAGLAACGTEAASAPDVNTDSDLHRVFALMPDVEQSRRYTQVVGVRVVAKYFGVPLPADDAPPEDVQQWFIDFITTLNDEFRGVGYVPWTTSDQFLGGLNSQYVIKATENTRGGLGIDIRSYDLVAVTGYIEGPNSRLLELVIGDLSATGANSTLASCEECPPHETVRHQGVDYFTWGEDGKMDLRSRMKPPIFDFLGRGGQVRVADGYAYRTVRSADIEAAIDAETDAGPSLLDNPDWKAGADALSQYELVWATGSEESVDLLDNPWRHILTQVPGENLTPEMRDWLDSYPGRASEAIAASPELPTHEVAVTGLIGGDERFEVVMAVVYADNETAEQAAEALTRRVESGLRDAGTEGLASWSEYIAEAEFSASGRVVVGHIVPAEDEEGRSHYPLFLVLPVPGVDFVGGEQPPHGPTAEFLLQ